MIKKEKVSPPDFHQTLHAHHSKNKPESASFVPEPSSDVGPTLTPQNILQLQRQIGNQAVVKLLSQRAAPSGQIQRFPIYWQKQVIRKPTPKDNKTQLRDTRDLNEKERLQLVELLKGDKHAELLAEIQSDWKQAAKEAPPSFDALFATAAELTILEAAPSLDKPQTEGLAKIIDRLSAATRAIANISDVEQAQLLRDTVQALVVRSRTLWAKSPFQKDVKLSAAVAEDGPVVDPGDITQGEIDGYRRDIRQMGVWGGLAEAEVGANHIGIQTDIFTVGPDGNYRRIIHIGNGAGGAGRSLLHRGNHYEVVHGAVDGQPFLPAHIVAETERDGNCLFEGLIIVRTGAKPQPMRRDRQLARLRASIAAGLTAGQIQGSLAQILTYGEVGGLGPETRRALVGRSHPPEEVQKALVTAQVVRGMYAGTLAAYQKAWGENPSAQNTLDLYEQLESLIPEPEQDIEEDDASEGGYVILEDKPNQIIVRLDSHQNKHQHKKTLIPQIGMWKAKKGTTFAFGRGLDWHRANTAVTMQKWALGLKATMSEGKRETLLKRPLSDGYIYDASALMTKGEIIVDYHCNPLKNE
ncbi:MAG: hypothetical protein ACYDBJ_06270 [Aggregatilineales bacterium]